MMTALLIVTCLTTTAEEGAPKAKMTNNKQSGGMK